MTAPISADEARCCCCAGFVAERDPDPWEGRLDDFCLACALTRCDAYPDGRTAMNAPISADEARRLREGATPGPWQTLDKTSH